VPEKASSQAKTVTIPAGQAVSNAADLTAGSLAMIIAPDAWTSANVSLLVSSDNNYFADLFDLDGTEVLRAMGPGRALLIPPALTQGALYLKLRSGPRANPVPQDADRTFTLLLI
jgi:hypothetical protein